MGFITLVFLLFIIFCVVLRFISLPLLYVSSGSDPVCQLLVLLDFLLFLNADLSFLQFFHLHGFVDVGLASFVLWDLFLFLVFNNGGFLLFFAEQVPFYLLLLLLCELALH